MVLGDRGISGMVFGDCNKSPEKTMSENTNVWEFNSLEVNDDGKVEGSAYSFKLYGEYDVVATVSSYAYEKRGESHMNHVPAIILQDESGSIIQDWNGHDSSNAEKAIDNALSFGESVYKDYEQYI
jgi:hypothetical protein